MTAPVPADRIEALFGRARGWVTHYAIAVTSEQRVYIQHSADCLAQRIDLTGCPFSIALDQGIDPDEWPQDTPVAVVITSDGRLTPAEHAAAAADRAQDDDPPATPRPKHPRTFDAMLRAAFEAGADYAHGLLRHQSIAYDDLDGAFAGWRDSFLPDPEPRVLDPDYGAVALTADDVRTAMNFPTGQETRP